MPQDDLTSMLNRFRKKERNEAARDLTQFVWEEAYRHAQKRIGEGLRGKVGPTAIVNEALNQAFQAVERAEQPIPNRGWFEGLVKKIISRRISDAVDHEKADKRSVERESDEAVEGVAAQQGKTSSEQAVAHEYSVRLAEILLSEPTEERRLAVTLGILAEYRPGEIHSVLARTVCKDRKTPAPSTIRVWLNEAFQRVEKELGSELED
jgi:hypothetical protein